MRATIANALFGRAHAISETSLSTAVDRWRKRVGYYSLFAAIPVIAGSPIDEARANELDNNAPVPQTRLGSEFLANCAQKPLILRQRGTYLLPHQRGRFDLVSTLSGGDNCPGTAIPAGTYTAAAPYVNSGDTTGANNTVTHANPCFYNYYGYWYNSGPDNIYTFAIAGRGPNPQIRITTTSPTYRPQAYILNGLDGRRCPAGNQNVAYNCAVSTDASSPPGSDLTISASQLANLPNGVPLHLFIDSAFDGPANQSSGPYTVRIQDLTVVEMAAPARRNSDFDGDGKADLSVYRPSTGVWYLNRSTAGPVGLVWGTANDKIAPEDFDGDGKDDIAIFRPSDGRWHILHSRNSTLEGREWGAAGDIPATGDFTGDSLAEVAVFRPSNGTWYYTCGGGCFFTQQFANNDIPVVGDYDGDGFADLAVFRPSTGVWIIHRSSLGGSQSGYQFGVASDKVVPADYDGDGKTDIAVYRPTEGRWYIANSGGSPAHTTHQFGTATDIPVPADYDGDGKADIAIFRPSDGNWWINRTTAGLIVIQWGQNGDKPTPNAFGN